jgi:hypothetical protein
MVERIAMLLQQEKVHGVFVLQPMLIMERERSAMPEVERKLFEFNRVSYLPNYEEFMRRAVPIVRELERPTVEKFGARFLDATPLFKDATGQVFTDYAHLTPSANEMLASFIANNILETIGNDLAAHRTTTLAFPDQ